MIAVAVWWLLMVASAFEMLPTGRAPRVAVIAGVALATFSALAAASTAWASSAEHAFLQFDLDALYVALFGACLLIVRREDARRCVDGIAIGIALVALIALASRCFPDLVGVTALSKLLPSAQTRLSYPLEYWNGLGILIGLGFGPLLATATLSTNRPWVAGLALAPVPAMGAALYLTSSRGGAIVAVVAVLVFVACTGRRLAAVSAAVLAAAGTGAAIAVLQGRRELVDGPLHAHVVRGQGASAAALIVAVCIVVGVLHARLPSGRLGAMRMSRATARAIVTLAAVAVIAGVAIAHPSRQFNAFRQPPPHFLAPQPDFVRAHLLSGNSSGRWQFWEAAVDAFETRPLIGRGAGSFEQWWAQHGSLAYFVRNAHSLYLETLAELGVAGLCVLLLALVTGVVAGVRRLSAADGDHRVTLAGALAAYVAFLVGAGIDWVWQLPVVGGIGIALLALLTGRATSCTAMPAAVSLQRRGGGAPSRRFAAQVAVIGVGWLMICAQGLPWLVQREVRKSEAGARRGDLTGARRQAVTAADLQPWASSPYLQLSLVAEQAGNLPAASRWIAKAISRAPEDWRLWLVSARIAASEGAVAEARKSLARARSLNPRAPLLAGAGQPNTHRR